MRVECVILDQGHHLLGPVNQAFSYEASISGDDRPLQLLRVGTLLQQVLLGAVVLPNLYLEAKDSRAHQAIALLYLICSRICSLFSAVSSLY